MVKKIIVALILLTALCHISCCGGNGSGNAEGDAEHAVKASIDVARIAAAPVYYEAVGTVKAETASTLSGKILGAIKAVNVREGDRITEGQLLILIDARQVAARLQEAKAALGEALRSEAAALSAKDAAKAGAELAQVTYNRYLKLKEDNAASLQEFDQIEIRSRQAEAGLKQAEAALEAAGQKVKQAEASTASAEVARMDAEISAPFDGVVTARMVDVGDLASPGTPLLSIEKAGSLEIDAIIPEDCIRMINPDQDLEVIIPALQDRSIQGKVKSIITAADPKSRTFTIKVSLPEVAGLHSGMFARINIPTAFEDMLLISPSALVLQGQLTGIFILNEEKRARFRIIRTGRKTGGQVEIISGLKAGTYYVISPPAGLKDGIKVESAS